MVRPGDSAVIFNIAMERLLAVCGRKWAKRAIGMTAAAEQLEFVWRAARYALGVASGRDAVRASEEEEEAVELAALHSLRERIVEKLPAEARGHFSIDIGDIEALRGASSSCADGVASGVMSSVSLETVGEALAEDADWEDWLASVMRLLTGYPQHLQLPKDPLGRPDFMDAW